LPLRVMAMGENVDTHACLSPRSYRADQSFTVLPFKDSLPTVPGWPLAGQPYFRARRGGSLPGRAPNGVEGTAGTRCQPKFSFFESFFCSLS
jgi:hypothetical protein